MAGAGAAAGKGPRRLSHPRGNWLAGARTSSRHRSPCVATSEGADCRRQRRGPQVRQDREGRNESIARSAPCRALAPFPRRGTELTDERSWRWVGYAIAGAGNAVGIDVGVAVGSPPPSRTGEARRPVCGAGLRSLPAKQHAPKARPSPRHRPWPASSRLPYSKGHRSPGAAGPATGQQRAGPGGCAGPAAAAQDHYRARLSDRWLSRSLPGRSCTSPAGRRARR
jgi:hypothetical protein